jgi:hypothetical protein
MRRASLGGLLYECLVTLVVIALFVPSCSVQGQALKLRHRLGAEHGFFVLRSVAGATLASGELTQYAYAGRVKLHVVFHFRDGSLDDETTWFSQEPSFRLIRDRHIQSGPSFPNPSDVTIDAPSQQVSVRDLSKGGNSIKTEHMDLPPDLANGIIFTLVQDLQAGDPIEVPYVALSPKPRMVKLAVAKAGEEQFNVGGRAYKAVKYDVKVRIGGIAGVVAPMIGKQPPDDYVWVTDSRVPAIVRIDAAMYTGGPTWSVRLASPVW